MERTLDPPLFNPIHLVSYVCTSNADIAEEINTIKDDGELKNSVNTIKIRPYLCKCCKMGRRLEKEQQKKMTFECANLPIE